MGRPGWRQFGHEIVTVLNRKRHRGGGGWAGLDHHDSGGVGEVSHIRRDGDTPRGLSAEGWRDFMEPARVRLQSGLRCRSLPASDRCQVGIFGADTSLFGGDTSPFGGDTFPFGGDTSPLGGDTSPLGGDTSLFGANTSPFGGDTSPLGGDTSPFGADTSPFGGDTSPFGGDTFPFGADTFPFGADTFLFGGDTSPFGGDTSPFGGDTFPFGGDTSPFGGDTSPFRAVWPGLGDSGWLASRIAGGLRWAGALRASYSFRRGPYTPSTCIMPSVWSIMNHTR
jgi:hypothetical protein